jgi:hypothetical protein
MTMEISTILSNTGPLSERPQSAWCCFLTAHLEYLANLVWYLVMDPVLVEHVMVRALAQLETTPFDASEARLPFEQARRALIGEVVSVLRPPRESVVTHGPKRVYDPPDFRRLAFVLKQVPQSSSHSSFPETKKLFYANKLKCSG